MRSYLPDALINVTLSLWTLLLLRINRSNGHGQLLGPYNTTNYRRQARATLSVLRYVATGQIQVILLAHGDELLHVVL